jgi:hypothetical protein
MLLKFLFTVVYEFPVSVKEVKLPATAMLSLRG